jgi:hypothetical protein
MELLQGQNLYVVFSPTSPAMGSREPPGGRYERISVPRAKAGCGRWIKPQISSPPFMIRLISFRSPRAQKQRQHGRQSWPMAELCNGLVLGLDDPDVPGAHLGQAEEQKLGTG